MHDIINFVQIRKSPLSHLYSAYEEFHLMPVEESAQNINTIHDNFGRGRR